METVSLVQMSNDSVAKMSRTCTWQRVLCEVGLEEGVQCEFCVNSDNNSGRGLHE